MAGRGAHDAQKLSVLPDQAQELDLAAALRRTPRLEQGRAIEAMNAAGRAREQGRDRDIAKDIGLPPRTRDRGMER